MVSRRSSKLVLHEYDDEYGRASEEEDLNPQNRM